MSLYSTSSPSIEQTRLYLTRPPSVACTWWKRMSLSSVAEYSFTPMLTRPNDTAPRQIDRMPPLSERGPLPGQSPGDRPGTGQDHRIGAPGFLREVERRATSLGRRSRSVPLLDALGLRGEAAVLHGVVGELEDVGPGDHRHRQGREPGRPGYRHVPEHEAGAHPLGEAERAGDQLADRVLH